ncbi:MAG TPA: Lrp/AsnC family transcriptional regulator [Flavobacteriales bacterium]|jgi:Lrp/AsnC family leucine-responsive transcriptional regulator|nr:Lrp/AsnC family transcriptional regulator [Flavobacteriales bacterium]HPH82994.1 Lrp/AsnC family transcriptional regulator [Flavobacteriales bacterium]
MSSPADKLDAIDYKILKLLQEDGRMTNLELSNQIGLSPAPTLERVKKLEKQKFIDGYHARLNRSKLKLGVSVFIEISLARQVENVINKFRDRIMGIPEIMECYQITGNSDYLLKVLVQDIPAFEKLIADQFSKMEEVRHVETMLIISEMKQSKTLPLKYD